jgi:hypothetical protein
VASFENGLANVEASLTILKWMVGFDLVLTIAIIGMLFFPTNSPPTQQRPTRPTLGSSLTHYFEEC